MKLPLFIILTGMVTIVFAGGKLQKDHKGWSWSGSPNLPAMEMGRIDHRFATLVGEPVDTLPKQSYIQFTSTGTSIVHNGVEVALRRKNGTWKVIDSRKALETMYDNIYKRDSVRRGK